MNDSSDGLQAVLISIVARLTEAAANRRSPMHVPVVGTADGDLRMMVLRSCDAELSQLRFHTDARSPKVAAVGRGAPVSILAFDPQDKVQIRARGLAQAQTDGPIADAAWTAASAYARRCYLAEMAPGTSSGHPLSGLPAEVEGIRPGEAQLLPARANFAVLLVGLTRLDWLCLAHDGHRRARFERGDPEQAWQGTWAVP